MRDDLYYGRQTMSRTPYKYQELMKRRETTTKRRVIHRGYGKRKRTSYDVIEIATLKQLPNKNLRVVTDARYVVRWFVRGAVQTRDFLGLEGGREQAMKFVAEEL